MTSNYNTSKRLYKSRTNKMIDGVCGGIAEHFGLDPTIVRVVWVVFTLMGGAGIILYIAAMIIMPTNREYVWNMPPSSAPGAPGTPGDPTSTGAPFDPNYNPTPKVEHRRFWGIVLILIGALILLTNLIGELPWFDWFDLSWEIVFPVMMIAIGIWVVMMYVKRSSNSAPGSFGQGPVSGGAAQSATNPDGTANAAWTDIPGSTQQTFEPKVLRRSIIDRKLFGVCGGIAKYFGIDPTVVRVGYVLLVIASVGWGLLLYIILAFVLQEERYADIR